jgi:hypothetical protein
MPDTPTTKYAKSGNLHIAYQVVGDGPNDLVLVPGWVSHVDPERTSALALYSTFARLARGGRSTPSRPRNPPRP